MNAEIWHVYIQKSISVDYLLKLSSSFSKTIQPTQLLFFPLPYQVTRKGCSKLVRRIGRAVRRIRKWTEIQAEVRELGHGGSDSTAEKFPGFNDKVDRTNDILLRILVAVDEFLHGQEKKAHRYHTKICC